MPPKLEKGKLDGLKAAKLRQLCEIYKVESSGKKADMIERLMNCTLHGSSSAEKKGKEPAAPERLDDRCQVILLTSTEIADDTTMIHGAKRASEEVPEEEELCLEHEPLTAGNLGSLSLASLPREMGIVRKELVASKEELAEHKQVVAVLEKRVFSLESRLHDMGKSAEAYHKICHRFIDTYGRDTNPSVSTRTRRQIDAGNAAAHGGDAKTDAELYRDGGGRTDFTLFRELYGFLPQIVWTITHMETINVLNIHAGIRADQRTEADPRFYGLFADFTNAWENSGFSTDYLDGGVKPPSVAAVTKAFWLFHDFLKEEEARKKEEARKRRGMAGE